jgi:hypothetical protein
MSIREMHAKIDLTKPPLDAFEDRPGQGGFLISDKDERDIGAAVDAAAKPGNTGSRARSALGAARC